MHATLAGSTIYLAVIVEHTMWKSAYSRRCVHMIIVAKELHLELLLLFYLLFDTTYSIVEFMFASLV